MANLKEKILQSLRNTKQVETTLNTIAKSQENLLKNYSNPVFNKKDKSKAYNVLELEGNFKLLFRIIILFPILPSCYFFHCLIYKTINFNYFLVCDNDLKVILLPCVKANKNIINKYFNKKINTIYLNSKLKEISLKGENNE